MRHPTPLLVDLDDVNAATALPRVALNKIDEGGYDERWLQNLVAAHPSVLPIQDIEAAFTPAISVCTELPVASGFVDNLLVTPTGNLIAVECKLWRNPEARRKVVAQVIDYAKDLQHLDYSGLESAVRSARKDAAFRLYDHAMGAADEPDAPVDEPRFVDTVSRNLRKGRCLLLIVGDGVTEEAEAMGEFLQQHAGIHFALAFVQLAVHELPGTSRRLVTPLVALRTTNIVRGIVHVDQIGVTVAPPTPAAKSDQSTTLSEDEFFDGLDAIKPGTSARLRDFLARQEDLHVEYEVRKTLIVRMAFQDNKALPFVVSRDGTIDTGYPASRKELQRRYAERLAAAIPGSVVKETPKTWYVARWKNDGTKLTIWDVLDNESECREALEALYQSMNDAAKS
jgi:hypothetical protein